MNKKCVVVYSGGMDSFTLLHRCILGYGAQNILTLGFRYGQKHIREMGFARSVCNKLSIERREIDLLNVFNAASIGLSSSLTSENVNVPEGHYAALNMTLTVVPGRNTIMLAIAMAVAQEIGADSVYYRAHAGDHTIYPDCRSSYIRAMDMVFTEATESAVELNAPFQYWSKGEILVYGLRDLGLKPEDYANTYTCYNGNVTPCGKCGACTERAEAFAFSGAVDPTAVLPTV